MNMISLLKKLQGKIFFNPIWNKIHFIFRGKVEKQKAELEFWKMFYKVIAEEPSIEGVFRKVNLGSLERRKEFNLSAEQYAALAIRERLQIISKTMSFPRYNNALHLKNDELAGKCVLDVGCGPMGAVSYFKAAFRVGVDELICEYSKIGYPLEIHPVLYVKGVSEDLPFPDNQFDAVVSVNALDHVKDFKVAISEIHRVLKPGGKIYLNLNYRDIPTITEPIVFSDKSVKSTLSPYFVFNKIKSEPTEFGFSINCYHGVANK